MKSIIRKRTYQAIYRLLDRVSPLPGDCGLLCGAACCSEPADLTGDEKQTGEYGSETEMGIYLLPGEEKLFTRKENWLHWTVEDAEDFDFPDSWHGKIYFVRCSCAPHCPREMRPLQCRFFPLAPHFTADGRLVLIRSDLELPYVCPLIRDRMELTPSFIKATYTVWTHLIRDPLIFDLVVYDSSFREDGDADVVYPYF